MIICLNLPKNKILYCNSIDFTVDRLEFNLKCANDSIKKNEILLFEQHGWT